VEAPGAFSCKTEGRRIVEPQQDCLKWNSVRNPGEKGREAGDKEPSPGFGNINSGVSESRSVPVEHIRE